MATLTHTTSHAGPARPAPLSYSLAVMDALTRGDFDVYLLLTSKEGVGVNPVMPSAAQVIAAMDVTPRRPGWSALHVCAAEGLDDAVGVLLRTGGVDLDVVDETGRTALFLAAEARHHGVAKALCEAGCDVNRPRTHVNGALDDSTPLLAAVHRNDVSIVRTLLEFGGDPNFQCSFYLDNPSDVTVLGAACVDADSEIVDLLCASGANVNVPQTQLCGRPHDPSPLMSAARRGNETMVATLLAHGANLEYRSSRWYGDKHDWRALDEACNQGATAVVRLLVEAGSDVHANTTFTVGRPARRQPIHLASRAAIRSGDGGCLSVLIHAGTDPWWSPELLDHYAVHGPAVALLLDSRPSPYRRPPPLPPSLSLSAV